MDNNFRKCGHGSGGTAAKIGLSLLVVAAIAGFGIAVMLLWNWLIPDIFGFTAISFWQALGLLALSRILFGNMFHGFGKHSRMGMRKNHIHEKWMKMTPEERKEFMKKRHFGFGFGTDYVQTDKPEDQN